MGRAYTRRLMSVANAPGHQTVVCPVGKRWVVICADILSDAAGTNPVSLQVQGKGQFWYTTFPGPGAHQQWQGRQVVYAGEILDLWSPGAIEGMITGYEFSDP